MTKKITITISGKPGAGKTIVGNWLFVNLPWANIKYTDEDFERSRDLSPYKHPENRGPDKIYIQTIQEEYTDDHHNPRRN